MDYEAFKHSISGKLVPTIDGARAFVPAPLPPTLNVAEFADALADAALRIGELRGVGTTISNPYVLIRPLQRSEAVASSAIEGTITSLAQLMLFEAGAPSQDRRNEAHEVRNYVHALEHGIGRLSQLPVSLRLMSELHEILLEGVAGFRGGRVRPGEFRMDQNWIGAPGDNIHSARFVPPPPQEMKLALGALEKFIHSNDDTVPHVLVHLALIHYQFEAIHPFPDGNGRVGRLLIPLIMAERELMSQPLLYLSSYLERYKQAYYDRMLEVSRSGAWSEWIRFFLGAVAAQAKDTIDRVHDLRQLQGEYRDRLQSTRTTAFALQLADAVFERPYISVPDATRILGVTYRAARNTIDRLTRADILRELPGPNHPKLFLAHGVFGILNRPGTF